MASLRHVPVSCGNAECYVVIGVTFIRASDLLKYGGAKGNRTPYRSCGNRL